MVERKIERKEIYEPSIEEFVKEELPTVTVKRARIRTGAASNRLLASYAIRSGTVSGEWHPPKTMRVTRLRVAADRAAWFMVCDRSGTIDFPYLEAAGAQLDLGEPGAPVCSVGGTFTVRQYGSYAGGTYIAAFEGVVPRYGTEAIS